MFALKVPSVDSVILWLLLVPAMALSFFLAVMCLWITVWIVVMLYCFSTLQLGAAAAIATSLVSFAVRAFVVYVLLFACFDFESYVALMGRLRLQCVELYKQCIRRAARAT